jgi:hypothetical protein
MWKHMWLSDSSANFTLSISLWRSLLLSLLQIRRSHIRDQATALQQAGVLPGTVPVAGGNLRLPVGGRASTKMFVDETSGQSNAMLGSGWGVQATRN